MYPDEVPNPDEESKYGFKSDNLTMHILIIPTDEIGKIYSQVMEGDASTLGPNHTLSITASVDYMDYPYLTKDITTPFVAGKRYIWEAEPVDIVAVTGVTLDRDEVTLELDEVTTLVATVAPLDAFNQNIRWSSSKEDIVSVDDNGEIRAKAIGTATITVTTMDGEFIDECVVTVSSEVYKVSRRKNYDGSYTIYRNPEGGTIQEASEVGSTYVNYTPKIIFDIPDGMQIMAEGDISRLLATYDQLETIEGLEHLNTENVTNMSGMFDGCKALQTLDLSNFNTSNVTDMSSMFKGCVALTSINFKGFNTSNVTSMKEMFYDCQSLIHDLSSFDTSNVTDMSNMFYLNYSEAESGLTLDLTNFNTSKVENMSGMFYKCYAAGVNLSSFNTSKVTDMSYMFSSCMFTSFDLSMFNTSNVINMSNMFEYSSEVTTLDLSSFDTSNVTNMKWMFFIMVNLESVNLSSFNTSKVSDMSNMFYDNRSMKSLDLSSFDISALTEYSHMLSGRCKISGTAYAKTQAECNFFNEQYGADKFIPPLAN